MIQVQLKLRPTDRQERILNRWLWHLSGLWNWTIKKIEHDAKGGIYHTPFGLKAVIKGHGRKIGLSQDALDGTVSTAHAAWQRCFKKLARKPRLKGRRNRLNSIAFCHGRPFIRDNRVSIPVLGRIRFHRQFIPAGHVGQMRIAKRASGWYLYLSIQAEPEPIPQLAVGSIGIDAGFRSLLTFSDGEKVAHPRELEATAERLAQAQRGGAKRLAARLNEKITNQRKDRNHKLSRKIIAKNQLIVFSADHHQSIKRRFGKSVTSSGHAQLRSMLAYKSRAGGRQYIEVSPVNSTKTCSNCGALSGPSGLRKLAVRQWTCSECGTLHDRDVNAAINTLNVGAGMALERKVA